jgi:hypothetical protein
MNTTNTKRETRRALAAARDSMERAIRVARRERDEDAATGLAEATADALPAMEAGDEIGLVTEASEVSALVRAAADLRETILAKIGGAK